MITGHTSERGRLADNPLYSTTSKGNPLSVSGGKWPFGWTLLGVLAVSGLVWWLVSLAFRGGA